MVVVNIKVNFCISAAKAVSTTITPISYVLQILYFFALEDLNYVAFDCRVCAILFAYFLAFNEL